MKDILAKASQDLGIPVIALESVLEKTLRARAEQLVNQTSRFTDLEAIEKSLPSSVRVPRLREKIDETLAILVNDMTRGKTLESLLREFNGNLAYKHQGYRFQYAMTQVIVDQAKTLVDIETVIKALAPHITGVSEARHKRADLQLAQTEEAIKNFLSESPSLAEICKRIQATDLALTGTSNENARPLRTTLYEAWLNACTTRQQIETSPPYYVDEVIREKALAKLDELALTEVAASLDVNDSIESCRILLDTFNRYPRATSTIKKAWDAAADVLARQVSAKSSLATLKDTYAKCRLESSQEQKVRTLWDGQALKSAKALVAQPSLTLFEVKEALGLCRYESRAYAMLARAAVEIWGIMPALGLK